VVVDHRGQADADEACAQAMRRRSCTNLRIHRPPRLLAIGERPSVSAGVPINDVSAVMGHEQTSTTLDRYTHPSQDRDRRVRSVFADFLLTPTPDEDPESDE
jgi:integrase